MSQTRWISGFVLLAALSALSTPLGAETLRRPTPTVVGAVSHLLLPTSANVNGQFGAVFKTKVSIFNPTTYDYTIRAGLSTQDGEIASSSITIFSGETVTFGNFLSDVFGYYGAGAIDLDSGNDAYRFIVSAQVYVDTGAGRYTTSVQFADDLGAITPDRPGYAVGISVNSNFRTNIGCASNSSAPQVITLRAFDRDFFLGRGRTRHHRVDNDRVLAAMHDRLDALRHRELAHVNRMTDREVFQVDLDELGQVGRQTLDLDLVHRVIHQRRGQLDRRRDFLVHEVQRHLHVDLLVGGDALEVDVIDLLLPRVHVHRA